MLAAPLIEGVLPAFYADGEGIATIEVPFSFSRAVNQSEIAGFRLKIKNIQGDGYISSLTAENGGVVEGVATFKLNTNNDKYSIGNFYKAQLAFVDSVGVVGYYSTVGIIKFTTKPHIEIVDLYKSLNNRHKYSYTGLYNQYKKDSTEKVYSYRFVIKDDQGAIVEDTGDIVHNNSNDEIYYESTDVFHFSKDLEANRKYSITYSVTTNNNAVFTTPPYKIVANQAIMAALDAKLITTLNYENGYIKINLQGATDDKGVEIPVRGMFLLSRSSEDSNYTEWEEIAEFSLQSQKPSSKEWYDFTIEQGKSYKYSLQQFNKNELYSNRIESDIINADFEDMFLYDGERQLKIKFNPKVSSFKKDLLESKVDTLGSKYPFIFRNGQVEYKEFPISGLISYLMDEENLFYKGTKSLYDNQERHETSDFSKVDFPSSSNAMIDNRLKKYYYEKNYRYFYVYDGSKRKYVRWINSYIGNHVENYDNVITIYGKLPTFYQERRVRCDEDIISQELKTTNLVSYNVAYERDFKLEVLNWLTNGKPKLFKSPNEGNYLVRLMNTSLSPNDQLGRMIHSFSSTAYEIADTSYTSLITNGIIPKPDKEHLYFKFKTIPLHRIDSNYTHVAGNIPFYRQSPEGVNLYFAEGELLKEKVEYLLITDALPGTKFNIDGTDIVIGRTGMFEATYPVSSLIIKAPETSYGQIIVGYYSQIEDSFSQIKSVDIRDVIAQQFIGEHENILSKIENVESKILTIYNLSLLKRPVEKVYYKNIFAYEKALNVTLLNYKNFYVFDKDTQTYIPSPENYIPNYEYYTQVPCYGLYSDFNYNNLLASLTLDGQPFKVPAEIYDEDDFNELIKSGTSIYYIATKISGNSSYQTYEEIVEFNENIKNYYIDQDIKFNSNAIINELNLYSYELNIDPLLGLPRYSKMSFIGSESQKGPKQINLENRTVSNPNLSYSKDFALYANAGQLFTYVEGEGFIAIPAGSTEKDFNPDITYLVKKPVEYIWDVTHPDKIYMSENCYNDFLNMWVLMKQDGRSYEQIFEKKYSKYTTLSHVESKSIDVGITGQFNTGMLKDTKLVVLGVGVYAELSYKLQLINFDLTAAPEALINIQQTLKNYNQKLTADYMIQECVENDRVTGYLTDIKNIRDNYKLYYQSYLNQLAEYLLSLEEE